MNTKSSPSAYRYCIVRLSTLAVSTLVPALNVLSTTLPLSTFFSVVRTKAPPLPGLTCWNSTTFHSCPSRFSVMPFLWSLVVAMRGTSPWWPLWWPRIGAARGRADGRREGAQRRARAPRPSECTGRPCPTCESRRAVRRPGSGWRADPGALPVGHHDRARRVGLDPLQRGLRVDPVHVHPAAPRTPLDPAEQLL